MMDPRVAQPGHYTNHSFRIIPYNYNCGSEVAKCCWKTLLSQVTVSMHTQFIAERMHRPESNQFYLYTRTNPELKSTRITVE